MSPTHGSRFGRYEVLAKLGQGGMGEVYRARDAQLGRDVALKVLPRLFVDDPVRRARFAREAQVLASLNHPHVAAIYGIERDDGEDALVLELVEGPTLATRIFAGRLPVGEALAIATQVAHALQAAHDQGIIHRDLKPSNIKVRPDGTVKVLDFGLAKLAEDAGESRLAASPHTPTLTSPAVTVAGAILGTASYMSPEQARGHGIDKRSDVWAFGCVLYEMLTGIRVFDGETTTDVLAAILGREPDWEALPETTPPSVKRLLRQCLERDRKKRRRDIGDAILELDTSEVSPRAAERAPAASRRPLAIAVVVAVAALAALVAVLLRSPVAPAGSGSRPSIARITSDAGFTADPAISRDGALVAYASDRGGGDQLDLWVQQAAGSTPIRVTRDAFDEREPSFSPDGSQIVFRSERDGGGIYVVPTFGSEAPRLLASGGRRPRFSPDGRLVAYWTGSNIGFSARAGGYHTFIVPVAGGAPRDIAPQMTLARFPVWSTDGKALLVLGSQAAEPRQDTLDWWVVPLNGGEAVATGALPLILTTGMITQDTASLNSVAGAIGPDDWAGSRVLFSNFQFLWSIALDPQTFMATGSPQRLTLGTNHDAQAVTSASGAIAFSSASFVNTVFGLSLDSSTGAVSGLPARLTEGIAYDARPSSSADGRLVAYRSSTPQSTVIVKNLAENRLIDLGIRPSNFGPAMSPDGRWVAFETPNGVDVVPSHGGPSRTLCRECGIGDWTEDSTGLAVVRDGRLSVVDAMSASVLDVVVGRELDRPFLSPNRRLMAFRSQANETNQVHVARLASGAPAAQDRWIPLGAAEVDVRPAGWSSDGRLLYIVSSRDGARCLYAVRVDRETGQPQAEAFVVRHFHGTRNAWAGTTGVLSTGPASAVRGGRFVYDLATFSANIWLMRESATPNSER